MFNSGTLLHFSWTVWHEGVRIYDDNVPGNYRGINDIRIQSKAEQSHNPGAQQIIMNASNNELTSLLPIVTGQIFNELNLPLHFSWVAYHEGKLDAFRQALADGKFSAVRDTYHSEQEHNPNARNLLAGVSNQHIANLINDL